MLPTSQTVRTMILAAASHFALPHPRKLGRFAVLCLVAVGTLCLEPDFALAGTETATVTTLAVTSGTSAVTIVASGTVVALTASVQAGATALTTGQVNFCDASAKYCTDIHLLGTAQLIQTGPGAGTAVLKFRPGIGSHSYKALFLGTTAEATSSSVASALTVTGTGVDSTTASIAQSGTQGNYALMATVSGNVGILPTGTVSFLDTTNANYVLGSASLDAKSESAVPNFMNSSSPTTGPNPQSITVADFNGDGKADLAVATYSTTVSILLGNGDGTFSPSPSDPVSGFLTGSITAGDFNGDGKADFAVTLPDAQKVMVFLGNGDGTFTVSQTIQDADGPFYVTTADFNGDGIADLAVANPAGKDVTILLGIGDGTFTKAQSVPATISLPVSLAVGDFNGDGKADLAVLNEVGAEYQPGSVSILLGNGDGTFTTMAQTLSTGNNPLSITAGDFNGDGKLDLAVTNSNIDTEKPGSLTILLGNGDGTFSATAVSPATGLLPYSVAVGDFNGDGHPDLVTANSNNIGTATVLLGNGDGTFATQLTVTAGNNPLYVATADFNGDGLTDFVTVDNGASSAFVLLSQLSGTATATVTVVGISPVGTGTHLVDASYSGDANYAASVSNTTGLNAQLAATTLALSANPTSSGYGHQVALTATLTPTQTQDHKPSGTVTFLNGTTSLGTATLSSGLAILNVTSLPVGPDTITATYTGDPNFASSAASSVTETVIVPIGTAVSTVAVAPSASIITNEQAVNVTVSVSGGSGQATPSGTITLASGAYTAQLPMASGAAVFKIAAGTLTSGANVLTASYSGDPTYGTANGTTTVTVSQATIAIPSPSPVSPGASATATATLATGSTYSGTMNLTCTLSGSPAAAQSLPTCSLNPASLTFTSESTGTSTMTVNTTAASTTAQNRPSRRNLVGFGSGGAVLAFALMFGVPSKRRRWISMLILLLVAVAAGAVGCGGGSGQSTAPPTSPSTPATSAGSYTFTLTGTDTVSAKITTSATVTVTVQ